MHFAGHSARVEFDDASVQSDAYIDALLNGHARLPIPFTPVDRVPERNVRQLIRLLETGLPRFHPSFLFEERLAEQLRTTAAENLSLSAAPGFDRLVLVGGALASGLSLGAAAMVAWRRRQG
jgi:hypothetical protein